MYVLTVQCVHVYISIVLCVMWSRGRNRLLRVCMTKEHVKPRCVEKVCTLILVNVYLNVFVRESMYGCVLVH